MEIKIEELNGIYKTTIATMFNKRVSKHLDMVVTIKDGIAAVTYLVNMEKFDTLPEAVDAYNKV
jgi:hypothetical protein